MPWPTWDEAAIAATISILVWLGLHVAAHVLFYVALAAHLALVLGHRARTGSSLLSRML